MATSDRPFKLVHANPRMVEDVVRVAAPQWAHRLDYAALTAVDKEYVAREQRNRDALQALIQDKVWRAPIKDAEPLANGERPYVDILLEFQADVDPRMAWRMADYIHALRLNQRESGVEQREGRLPDLLSVVIHNGAKAWNAPAVLPGPLVRAAHGGGPDAQRGAHLRNRRLHRAGGAAGPVRPAAAAGRSVGDHGGVGDVGTRRTGAVAAGSVPASSSGVLGGYAARLPRPGSAHEAATRHGHAPAVVL